MSTASQAKPATETFYRTADMLPPREVVVRVIWDGRAPFLAARTRDPRVRGRDRDAWLTQDGVLLPNAARPRDAARPWAGWHTLRSPAPDYWAPQWPHKWRAPLPEGVAVALAPAGVRMWSSRTKFAAVDEAEAADLAREMEADRESARAHRRGGGQRAAEPPERQWWLDSLAVTYSPAGAISPREAEGRLMRALLTEAAIRVERPSQNSFSQLLGRMVKPEPLAAGELAALDPVSLQPQPTGRDWDDCELALSWLKALGAGAPESLWGALRVVRLRASVPALAWASIGAGANGRSAEAARELYGRALAEVTAQANGLPTAGGLHAASRLAAIKRGVRR